MQQVRFLGLLEARFLSRVEALAQCSQNDHLAVLCLGSFRCLDVLSCGAPQVSLAFYGFFRDL